MHKIKFVDSKSCENWVSTGKSFANHSQIRFRLQQNFHRISDISRRLQKDIPRIKPPERG